MKTLKELGWSQEMVARAIGVTRPKYKAYLNGDNKLSVEEQAKLDVLTDRQERFKEAQSVALGEYLFHEVWKPSYKKLIEEG